MSELPLTAVDFVVLAIVLVSAALAFMRGFVHEVLGVGAWVGAAVATLYGFPHVQPHARRLIAIDLFADILAGVAIFLAVLVVLALISRWLGARVQNSSLGALDRSLGAVFGVARGALILVVAWLALAWSVPDPADRPSWVREAESHRLIALGGRALANALPGTWTASGEAAVERAGDAAERARDAGEAADALVQPSVEDGGEDKDGEVPYSGEEMDALGDFMQDKAGSDG